MWAPVSPAARTISSAPSTGPSGVNSTRSRAWVKVGTPPAAASAATRTYSCGRGAGRVPEQQADPQRPVGDIGFEQAEDAVDLGRAEAARCQRGSARLANSDPARRRA